MAQPQLPYNQNGQPYRYLRTDEYHLEGGVISLPAQKVALEIKQGGAWVSYNDRDVFMFTGDKLNITRCQQAILIAPIRNGDLVVFRVHLLP